MNWLILLQFVPTMAKMIQDLITALQKKATTTFSFPPEQLQEKKIEALATYLACLEQEMSQKVK